MLDSYLNGTPVRLSKQGWPSYFLRQLIEHLPLTGLGLLAGASKITAQAFVNLKRASSVLGEVLGEASGPGR